jgi:acetyl esterase/lipase
VSLSRREFLAAGLVAGAATACGFFGDDGPEKVSYGSAGSQFGELYVPGGDDPRGTIVLVHGGSWADDTDLTLLRPMARDLMREGYCTYNIEYRRVGEDGGGWPGTFDDVGTAIDHIATMAAEHPVDPDRTIVVGHSAGGTLALWAAGREGEVQPRGFLSLAGFTDLEACVEEQLLAGACARVLGGTPAEVPRNYREASPVARLPTGRRQALVHGEDDDVVPVRQSVDYAAAAEAAGDPVTLTTVRNTGHFQLIDVKHPAYGDVLTAIDQLMTSSPA